MHNVPLTSRLSRKAQIPVPEAVRCAQIGAVLGRRGSFITALREDSGCSIKVAKLSGPAPEGVAMAGVAQSAARCDC